MPALLRAGPYRPRGVEAWALDSLLRQQLLGSLNAFAVCTLAQVCTLTGVTGSLVLLCTISIVAVHMATHCFVQLKSSLGGPLHACSLADCVCMHAGGPDSPAGPDLSGACCCGQGRPPGHSPPPRSSIAACTC